MQSLTFCNRARPRFVAPNSWRLSGVGRNPNSPHFFIWQAEFHPRNETQKIKFLANIMSLKLQNRHFIQKEEGKFPAGAAIISNLLPKAKNKIGGTAELLSAGGGRNSGSPNFLIWHDEIHPRNETPLTLKLLLPVRSLPFCRSRGARPKLVAQESWGNQGYVVVGVLTSSPER